MYTYSSFTFCGQGRVAFHGATADAPVFFQSLGRPIPAGFNPADFLIDILFEYKVRCGWSPLPLMR
jgi:hypothetical protein